jgi:DNA-binding CsgD family transcriptional regulator
MCITANLNISANLADEIKAILNDPFADFNGLLNARQREAARLAAWGKTYEEIGDEMGIPTNTAGTMIKTVTKRTGMSKSALTAYMLDKIEEAVKIKES